MRLGVKRVYDEPAEDDGFRILVDRLWPRGLTKERARADLWLREIAPSNELRQWFGHDPARWAEFRRRYEAELASATEQIAVIRQHLKTGPVTLLYSAKDEAHNQAVVLRDVIQGRSRKR